MADKNKTETEGYKYLWKKLDINHTYNDHEIEILTRDKQEIRSKAQQFKIELEDTNPNIQIIHEYQKKFQDCQGKEKVLRECEGFILERKEELNA